jgi:phosphoglycerate dehydrogenase-like enzyme
MSANSSLPRVGLAPGVLAEVPADVLAAVDVVTVESDRPDADLSGLRFLALPPRGMVFNHQLPGLTELEVVQTASAGTDWIEPHLPPQVTLCNARGARDAPVAEWLLGALLGTSSHLLERRGARGWENLELRDLADWTVLVVGMGSIGRTLETYLQPLGSTVVGIASRARDDLHGIEELDELLPGADAVVLLAPLTQQTHHLISTAQLAAMRDGAVIINAARGAVLDTDALVAELHHGRIFAVLDVTDPEPLPDGHPLWEAPGLLSITPHIAGASPAGHRGAARLAADQLGRWVRGEDLLNVVASPTR